MNGVYTPVEEEADAQGDGYKWNPGIGYQSAGPKDTEQIAAAATQRETLDQLNKLAGMATRVEGMVTAYENYADSIESAHKVLTIWAEVYDVLVDGVPGWWSAEVKNQRVLREALISSLRDTAKKIADTYGVR